MDIKNVVVHHAHTPDIEIQQYLRIPGEPLYEKYEGGDGENPVVRASLYILNKVYDRWWMGYVTLPLGEPQRMSRWHLS